MSKIHLFFCLTLLSIVTACTVTRNPSAPENMPATIRIQTIPEDAKVYINDKLVSTTTPMSYTIHDNIFSGYIGTQSHIDRYLAPKHNLKIKIVKDGYESYNDVVKPQYINIIQKLKQYYKTTWPENLLYELKPSLEKERVTRSQPGKSTMEKTIIRWYFDSAPQGARIFWRVISSVPEEVKNTNELWLGSTPFEETRSFNIEGLTYENSRDVQIEIKVKCKGYVDQNKRFNVRQAIDQQEISSFFDLVEDPNR